MLPGTSWGSLNDSAETKIVSASTVVAYVACSWSNAIQNTYFAGCDPSEGCKSFSTLASAQSACVASQSCFGVTEHMPGSWELRGSNVPLNSPSGETSFAIVNVGTCHAPAPDPAWAARGAAAYAGLARSDPDAVWSFQGYSLQVQVCNLYAAFYPVVLSTVR
jgi:hypothetical protein